MDLARPVTIAGRPYMLTYIDRIWYDVAGGMVADQNSVVPFTKDDYAKWQIKHDNGHTYFVETKEPTKDFTEVLPRILCLAIEILFIIAAGALFYIYHNTK